MWKYENFTILIIASLVPFTWWGSIFPLFSWLWELVYGWSSMKSAIHFLPIALGMFPILPLSAGLQSKIRLKWVILIGQVLVLAGTVLLPFADSPERYWRFAFPGFLLGTSGCALIYTTTNIALLAVTPASVSGIVSAVFMAALQTSAATGVAVLTSIQTSVQPNPNSFKGRAAALWFLVAFAGAISALTLILMKDTVGPVTDPNIVIVKGSMEVGTNECLQYGDCAADHDIDEDK
jgi:MFS family permease